MKLKLIAIVLSIVLIFVILGSIVACLPNGDGQEPTPPIEYELIIDSTHCGSVTTPGEGTFTYDEGTVVDLVVDFHLLSCRFAGWTGNVDTIDDVYATETTITMNGDYEITAEFRPVIPQ